MNILHTSTIVAAAFAAGAINSVAGGGTLITFPALLGVGLSGQQANVTSTLGLIPGSVGGFMGHRQDLAGTREFALRLVPPSILGGVTGALLMLLTPKGVFDQLIPWLILTATLLMAANEPINKLLQRVHGHERTTGWWAGAILFQFLVGTYGGYFGAGIGILMLAALGLLGLKDIHQMNGLKNFMAFCINGIAIAAFVAFEYLFHPGNVIWWIVVIMMGASLLGGFFGSHMAHRVGRKMVRGVVIGIGFVLAGWYFYKMHGGA
jgi:uncharacterized protein